MADYHLLPAARADLLRRAGRHGAAAGAYREALALSRNSAEGRYLEGRLRETCAALTGEPGLLPWVAGASGEPA